MKKWLKYILIGLFMFMGANNVEAKKTDYFTCNYKSPDDSANYTVTIGYDDSWFSLSSQYADGVITKLDGKNVSINSDIQNWSREHQYIKMTVTNMCPEILYLVGKKVFLSPPSNDATALVINNSFSENLRNYTNWTATSYSCKFKFGNSEIETKVHPNYYGGIYQYAGLVVSEGTCPTTAFMVCKEGSKEKCYFSYASTKPEICNNIDDVDCYSLPNNAPTDVEDKVEEKIQTVSAIYKEQTPAFDASYGDTLTFKVFYDVNNNEYKYQDIFIYDDSESESVEIGLAYPSNYTLDSYKAAIINPIINSSNFPDRFYCGNISHVRINLVSGAVMLIQSDSIVCSTDVNTFIEVNQVATYVIENQFSEIVIPDNPNGEIEINICDNLSETGNLIRQIYNLLKYLIPILVIGLSIVDFLKVVINGEEKVFKESWSKLVKRIIIGIVILILPAILSLAIDLSGVLENYGITDNIFCILR